MYRSWSVQIALAVIVVLLSPVVGAGLGVYQDAEQFRSVLLEADFQFGLNVVHPSQGKIVGQCAMARDVHPSADALDHEVVNVDDFGKLRGHGFKAMFEFRVADHRFGLLDGGRLALDVGKDIGNFRDLAAHVGFELGDLIVGAFEGHALVEFDVLLDVQPAGKVLDADVMHVEIFAGGGSSDAIENILRTLRAREWLHGDVGIGQDAVNRLRHGGGQLAGALESDGARQPDGEVGEIAVPGPADAYAIDFENTLDVQDCVVDLGAHAGRRRVEQSVNGAAGQAPAHGNDNAGHEQSSDGIGIAQPVDAIGATEENQDQAQHHHSGRPNVGGKMQGVGFQRLAVVFIGDTAEHTRAPPVQSHGKNHHGKSGGRGLDFNVAKEEAHRGFVDDPGAGEQEQAGFDKSGKIFDFTVAVLMVGVRGFIRHSDREKCEKRRN